MLFDELPVLILENICRFLIDATQDSPHGWKRNLVYLSISSQLRQIGLPIVYGFVYFRDGPPNGSGFKHTLDGQHTISSAGVTNIGLVKSLNHTRYVKFVDIQINQLHYFQSLISDYKSIFDFKCHNWKNVDKLLFYLNFDNTQSNLSSNWEVESFVYDFKEAMPGITHLDYAHMNRMPKYIYFIKCLLTMYTFQIKEYYSNILYEIGLHSFTNNRLEIKGDCIPKLDQKIKLCCKNARFISIHESIQQLTTSLPVANKSSKRVIMFPKLHRLSLFILENDPDITSSNLISNQDSNYCNAKYVFPILDSLLISVISASHLEDLLNLDFFEWQAVTKLTIYIRQNQSTINDSTDDKLALKSNNIVKLIKMSMPHIADIQVFCPSRGTSESSLLHHMIKNYNNEKTELATPSSHSIKIPMYSSFTHLMINCASIIQLNIVKECVTTLIILKLHNAPPDLSWFSICNEKGKDRLTFTQLISLHINYQILEQSNNLANFDKWGNSKCNIRPLVVSCPKLRDIIFRRITHLSLSNLLENLNASMDAMNLEINYASCAYNTEGMSHIMQHHFSKKLSYLGNKIANTFPSVRNLIYKSNSASTFDDPIFSILNKKYNHQLKYIESDVSISPSLLNYTDHLESLNLETSDFYLEKTPKIYTSNLDEFSLNDNSGQFLWSWFVNGNKANTVGFPCLYSFCVRVWKNKSPSGMVESYKYNDKTKIYDKVYMPYVDTFTLEVYNVTSELNTVELHFGAASTINLIGPITALPSRGNCKSEILDSLDVFVKSAGEFEEEVFYNTTNSWFGHNQTLDGSSLTLENVHFDLSPAKTEWHTLKKLEFGYPIKCSLLIELLKKLPILTTLNIDKLVEDCLCYLPSSEMTISKSVNEIAIEAIESHKNAEIIGLTMLILGIVSLQSFKIDSMKLVRTEFVETFRQYYPHVVNISFT